MRGDEGVRAQHWRFAPPPHPPFGHLLPAGEKRKSAAGLVPKVPGRTEGLSIAWTSIVQQSPAEFRQQAIILTRTRRRADDRERGCHAAGFLDARLRGIDLGEVERGGGPVDQR